MGVVYRAVDPVLKRRVAIKVMSEAFAQNDELRERFLREAQAAGSLQHPNVITIYDFGEVDGHLYIAMEFVEGQDVAELLAHQVPLGLLHKLDIAIGVLQGLAFAHKRGIVHRDVKPANIRVDGDGNARIMDFGVAHLASSDMTRTGVMIGTPSYMAPEQITGGKVGPQTDIFSVGAVLYELLSGTRPFSGGPLQAVMYRVLSEAPMSLDLATPGLPPRLNEIVMRALAKDPEQRYATALDMANDLLAVRQSLDSRSSSPGTLSLRATIEQALDERRTSQFRQVRRRRFAYSSAGIAAAVVLVFAGWFVARRGMSPRDTATLAAQFTPSTITPGSAPASPGTPASARAPAPEQPRDTDPKPPAASDPRKSAVSQSGKAVPGTARVAQRAQSESASAKTTTAPANSPPASPPNPSSTGSSQSAASVSTGSVPSSGAPITSQQTPPPAAAAPSKPVPSSPTQVVAAPPPVPSAANASAEIGNVIEAYARAIESRDMAELRRVYGTITSDQASAFSEFFKSTRELRATLAVKSLQVDGSRATARVSGTYEFTTSAGRQQQTVAFEADLRHDAGIWKLVAVR
jgi:eukaryotic-like serine/threonine-protein kinase